MTLATVPGYDADSIRETAGHAIVVGGSMAGMLAARVLDDRYATVTVIDRDPLSEEATPRRGVPQSSQPHALLEGGRTIIEDLFPGYSDTLVDAGAVRVDIGADAKSYHDGVELDRADTGREMLCASRPLFETIVRRHLATLDGVELRGGCTVLDYRHDDQQRVVEGVRIRDESGGTTDIDADLIVDATGRTSQTPEWLDEHGYPAPPLDEVGIDLQYGTVQVRRPPDDRLMVLLPASHPTRRGGIVVPVEGDRWLVNLHGFHGDHPPDDINDFKRFANGLASPVLAELLEDAPITPDTVDRYPFPSSRRYRYEALDRFPKGLVVVGDAIASFNPIYAQGITVAAFEALVLHHALADGDDALATRFFDAAASIVENAWSLSTGPDRKFPETTGQRSSGDRIAGWYVSRLRRRACHDPVLTEALDRVIQFEQPPTSLFRPRVLWRVLSPVHGFRVRRRMAGSAGVATPSNER